ncbi:MAG: DUF4982 domain-containing protein [Bacteroidetes bacterium]|nr:DUF4982 domain-containing protein [Bacteroidota bacterium]
MRQKFYLLIFFSLLLRLYSTAQGRTVIDFNSDWNFFKGDDSTAYHINFDNSRWRKISLPHDWSIESDFIKDAPATNQGGSLPGGIGWYRKSFMIPPSAKDKITRIEFDGVYKNSEVWINGHYLGKRPYGYIAFSYDLTPYLFFDKQNVIAVRVDNSEQPDSRWYPGSGIYRDVKLLMLSKWVTNPAEYFIHTETTKDKKVRVIAETQLFSENKALSLRVELYDPQGKLIGRMDNSIINKDNYFKSIYTLANPSLWSPQTPVLYKAKFKVFAAEYMVDEFETTFGIRSFYFDAEKGFFLNDRPLKIKGVCLHHDLGILGAAFNKQAARRQLTLLKEMGCNAIRFSHNPPAAAILDLCDEMGFLVMDEAFDMWEKKKNKFDYHLYFDEWHKKDLEAMVLRDRNHPSVFMWSIGNELREQFDSSGTTIAKNLVSIVKELDPTRPVTCALTETIPAKNFIYKSGALDVLGFNYKDYDYPNLPSRFPGQKFIATETASALETRGVYQYPSDTFRIWPANYKEQDTFARGNKDYTCAAYDNTFAYWGNTHERSWLAVKKYPFMAGLFVWSGFDYLGEPLPYPKYPARSSYYGIIDLAGFPKDVYYMYQSEWTEKPVLHILPHWNWKRGDTIDVWAYYNNADEVELYLNGQSLGVRKKTDSVLHVMWRVPFAAGTLKAVSRRDGKIVLEKIVKTSGKASLINLSCSSNKDTPGNRALYFITVTITDKNGVPVPGADNLLQFSVSANAKIIGTDNGYEADTVCLKKPERKAWMGKAVVIIQPITNKGNITLRVSSSSLQTAELHLKIQ